MLRLANPTRIRQIVSRNLMLKDFCKYSRQYRLSKEPEKGSLVDSFQKGTMNTRLFLTGNIKLCWFDILLNRTSTSVQEKLRDV